MIDSADHDPAPKRIALGRGRLTIIRKILSERLATLEARKDLACSIELPKNATCSGGLTLTNRSSEQLFIQLPGSLAQVNGIVGRVYVREK
jgi:hypothetical protein